MQVTKFKKKQKNIHQRNSVCIDAVVSCWEPSDILKAIKPLLAGKILHDSNNSLTREPYLYTVIISIPVEKKRIS